MTTFDHRLEYRRAMHGHAWQQWTRSPVVGPRQTFDPDRPGPFTPAAALSVREPFTAAEVRGHAGAPGVGYLMFRFQEIGPASTLLGRDAPRRLKVHLWLRCKVLDGQGSTMGAGHQTAVETLFDDFELWHTTGPGAPWGWELDEADPDRFELAADKNGWVEYGVRFHHILTVPPTTEETTP